MGTISLYSNPLIGHDELNYPVLGDAISYGATWDSLPAFV